jgi:hypothetical protein
VSHDFAELLGYWIAQQRLAERQRDAAYADLQLWFKRLKLARQAGDEKLAQAAATRAEEARDRYELAGRRVQSAQVELAEVRRVAQAPDRSAFNEALRRSQHAIQEFQKLGILEAPDEFADPAPMPRSASVQATAPSPVTPAATAPPPAVAPVTNQAKATTTAGPRDRYADLPDDDLLDIEREALAMAEELMREREAGPAKGEPQ